MNKSGSHKLFKEGSLLFISTLVVNIGNYGINLLLGRWLGPADFSEVGLLVTLLLMLSFIALAFQLTAAKYAASYTADNDPEALAALIKWLRRMALITGIALAVLLTALSYAWQEFFKTRSPFIFPVFGLGMPLYLLMSINRGLLQGKGRYGKLALTYQAEMWARLLLSILLVWAGGGVTGITWSITLSLLCAYLASYTAAGISHTPVPDQKAVLRFLLLILIYECSQILINNSDTVLVKHFFTPVEAGLYAALALIGRIVYFSTWTVVTLLFPTVIKLEKEGKPHLKYFAGGLLLVGGVAAVIIAAGYLFPQWMVNILFGPAYLAVAPFLWKYAMATALFACANVFVYYNLSLDRRLPVWIMIAGGMLQIILIWFFHKDFMQVINIQIRLMLSVIIVMMLLQVKYLRRQHPAAATFSQNN